jgi:hypothetical protein
MAEKLVVLARLVLLRLQPRDALVAGADIEFQLFLLHLDVTGTSFVASILAEAAATCDRAHFRSSGRLLNSSFDLPNFLSAILQNEQLLQLDLHARMLGATGGVMARRAESSGRDTTEDDAGVDPAKAERVAQPYRDRLAVATDVAGQTSRSQAGIGFSQFSVRRASSPYRAQGRRRRPRSHRSRLTDGR